MSLIQQNKLICWGKSLVSILSWEKKNHADSLVTLHHSYYDLIGLKYCFKTPSVIVICNESPENLY